MPLITLIAYDLQKFRDLIAQIKDNVDLGYRNQKIANRVLSIPVEF